MNKFSDLKAGVIGTGFIGPVHIEALRRIGVLVTAICGSEQAREVAVRWEIPRVVTGYDVEKFLAEADVDVVHITSPNRHHHRQALAALAIGKHVVCEKPLAMTTAQTAEIVAAVKASGKVFAVNYNIRFYPAVLQMRAMAQGGELGEIIHVNGSYMQDWLHKDTDYNWRVLASEGGELRAVGDIGTHWLDTVCFILGSPVDELIADLSIFHRTRQRPLGEVQTFSSTGSSSVVDRSVGPIQKSQPCPVDTEDFANVLLAFANGARGNLSVSQVAAGRKNSLRIEIYGSKKSAWWCSEDPEVLHFGNRDGANETAIRATPAFGIGAQGFMDYPPGHVEGFPDTFKMNFRNIYSAIVNGPGERLFATANDGHQEVAMCEAILRSHRARSWTKVRARY